MHCSSYKEPKIWKKNVHIKADNRPQIFIYKTKDAHIDVQIKSETVWLSLSQMAQLFERDKSVISRHLNNIFKEGELERDSVVANFATTAADGKMYKVDYYNLDSIISVGYRVNSKRGIQFRQWATQKLKDYLIQGYSLNHQKMTHEGLKKIQKIINLIAKTLQSQSLVDERGTDVFSLILSYSKTWSLLFKYDENELEIPKGFPAKSTLTYEEALEAVHDLKSQLIECEQASSLFGQHQSKQVEGILGNIEQTFAGQSLYPSLQEKAAHLLYFIIKDHPFSDGNKRIGTFLFLLYLRKQGVTLTIFNDSTLVSLALLVAESDPTDKEIMIRLITNLLTLS